MKISVFGVGLIGGAWVRHYEAEDVLFASWNRTPKPGAPRFSTSAAEAARGADVLQIVVADPPAVQAVLDTIGSELGHGKIVVQSSTIDPDSSDGFASFVARRGAQYVEAPFTGSLPAAEARQTVFYLGGDAAPLDQVEPLLSLVSQVRIRVGTRRQASALKLAMNLQIAGLLEALAEGLVFARRAGISDDLFFSVLAENVAQSGVARLKEPKLRAADYAPQFSVKHLHKDLRLASRAAAGAEYPELEVLRERLRLAEERGLGDEDISAIVKLLV